MDKMRINQNNHYICPLPTKYNKMNNRLFYLVAIIAIATTSSSCKMLGGKNKGKS